MENGVLWIAAGIAIVFIAIWWLWDFKIRPSRLKKDIPTPSFSKNVRMSIQAIYNDKGDPEGKGITRIDWVWIHLAIYLIIGVIIYGWSNYYFEADWKVIASITSILLLISIGRMSNIKRKQLNHIKEVFSIVNHKLGYARTDRKAFLEPWKYVNVTSLTSNGAVAEVSLQIPTSFSVSSLDARRTFEEEFSQLMTSAKESEWDFIWKPEKRMLTAKRVPPLPTMVEYPGSWDRPWYQIPIGVSREGEEVWDLSLNHPQAVIVGTTGAGKSVSQRAILYHAFQHPDEIKMYGIDLKMVELPRYEGYPGMIKVAATYEEAHELIHEVHIVMKQRFERMKEAGVDHIDKLPGKEPAILVMFDESAEALEIISGTSPEAKETQAMQAEIIDKVRSIARLGRAAKVHLVLCTQRAQVSAIGGGDAKNNYQFRILLGWGDKVASNMALDSNEGTKVDPDIRGRGTIFRNGHLTRYQGYFTESDWPEKNGIYKEGFEPSKTNSIIDIDEIADEYENPSAVIEEIQQEKQEAETIMGSILEDTEDGVVEYLPEDIEYENPDEEFGFKPLSFSEDTVISEEHLKFDSDSSIDEKDMPDDVLEDDDLINAFRQSSNPWN